MKSLITCLAFVTTAACAQLRMVEMRTCPTVEDAKTCSAKCEASGQALVGLTEGNKSIAAVVPHKNNIPQEIKKVYGCDALDWQTFACNNRFEKLTSSKGGGFLIKTVPTPEECAELNKNTSLWSFNWDCYEPPEAKGTLIKNQSSFQCFTELKR